MKKISLFALLIFAPNCLAFCGFYVAKADASLYNQASQVVLARNDNKTALTMFSDFKGELAEFALVVPVPEILKRDQINVAERALIDRIDAFSAPRLVEYFDRDPCLPMEPPASFGDGLGGRTKGAGEKRKGEGGAHGVTIEAKYTIGEYDILILSAKESNGLETWLTENGYKIPKNASKALQPYLNQNLKFFVAKVNLKEQAKTGFKHLRPIQFAYESPRFMLPIRLGMVNSEGPQDMLIYFLTKNGRVETTNYRTVKLPTGQGIPPFVKTEFAPFYKSLFETAWQKEGKKVLFQEFMWNTGWCDPCAADPLNSEELRKLGVFWASEGSSNFRKGRMTGFAAEAFVTRLHVRYDAEHFPEDLMFQETSDTENYQGRYVLQHPWTGAMACPQADNYKSELRQRKVKEAETLASLTGWPIGDIYKKMGSMDPPTKNDSKKWYKKIFK